MVPNDKPLMGPPLILILSCSLFASSAYGWPPTYGSEFNFGRGDLHRAWTERSKNQKPGNQDWQTPTVVEANAAKEFAAKVKQLCAGDCTITSAVGKFGLVEHKVVFKNGYTFNISVDPTCVEIQTMPETLEQLRRHEPLAEKYIFSVAKALGFNIQSQPAHFNVGILSAFESDPKGFLRFFVNFQNFPELGSGLLGQDFGNAPPASHLRPEQRAALAKIVNDVNRGKIMTTPELAVRIQTEVYTHTPQFQGADHYQGLGMKYVERHLRLPSDRPFELRAPRQPQTAQERTLLAELFEKRMAFDKNQKSEISFLDVPKTTYSKKMLANRFRLYLAEMGADWNHFKFLLPEGIRNKSTDAFMSGTVNWKSQVQVIEIASYARYLSSSAWVRERMIFLLASPQAKSGPHYNSLLASMESALGPNANGFATEVLRSFVTAAKNGEEFKMPVETETIVKATSLKKMDGRLKCLLEFLGGGSP